VPHSDPEKDPVSEEISPPSQVGESDENSSSSISELGGNSASNYNGGAVCLSRPIPDAKPFM